jgi:hypothetical protein
MSSLLPSVPLSHSESDSRPNSQSEKKMTDDLREYWKLRVDVWFDVFKGHSEKCECEDCFQRFCEFFEWRGPGYCHGDECDCDYCMPASSTFCACAECIPDIVEFDKIGEVPFVPVPCSANLKTF